MSNSLASWMRQNSRNSYDWVRTSQIMATMRCGALACTMVLTILQDAKAEDTMDQDIGVAIVFDKEDEEEEVRNFDTLSR